MKRIFYTIILVIIILYIAGIRPSQFIKPFQKSHQDISDKIAQSRISIAYVLDEERWTSFSLNPEISLLKILTNASFPALLDMESRERWWYVIQYQIMDKDGKILEDREYYHHSKITKYLDKDTKEIFEPAFYLNPESAPSDLRIMLIDLSQIESPKNIRFRIAWKDPEIQDVILRAYYEENVPERKMSYLWHRISEDWKKNLARGNVYPYELLTDKEKQNLMRKIWRPAGPDGVEGIDYLIRNIYILKEVDGEIIPDFPVLPQGFFIDKAHLGIIPIPEGGGKIRLEFTAVGPPVNDIDQIWIRWFGRQIKERSEDMLSWSGAKAVFEKFFNTGLLEIETTRDITVRVFLITADEKQEITPESINIRTYVTHKRMPVIFKINHTGNTDTPFRVDFRCLNPPGPSIPAVRYEILTNQGDIFQEGEIQLSGELSLYDRVHGDISGQTLSEPVKRFFSLPPNTGQIRFFSDSPVLISAYTRPPRLVRQISVPDDYDKYQDDDRQPAWFSVQPEAYQSLILENRSVLLAVQYRTPEDRPELISGQYEWEAFYSQKNWKGRYLFTPWEKGKIFRKEQLSSVFRRIRTGKEFTLNFQHPVKGMKNIEARIFFLRRGNKPVPVEIFIDGNLFYKMKISGNRGEFQIPPIRKGKHRIKIKAPGNIKFYINHTGPGIDTLLKRFATRMKRSGHSFIYEKKEAEELVLIHFYTPGNKSAALRVKVKAGKKDSAGPYTGWTHLERRYIIQPNPGKVPVLNTRNEFTDQGRLCFLPLDKDLPPGRYAINVSMEKGNRGYIILSRITPGRFEKREFFRQKRIGNE